MKETIIVGFDEGTYSLSGRDITLASLSFTPVIESIAYIYNITQGRAYFSPVEALSNVTMSGLVISINSIYPVFGASDKVHIQLYKKTDYLDRITQVVSTVSYEHHEIHSGSHFYYNDSLTLNSGISQDYLITTPNTTRWGHFLFDVDGVAITSFTFFEATDKTGTTLQTIVNNNRNSATLNTITIHKGTSGGTTDGTSIKVYSSGAATAQSRTPSQLNRGNEIILKQNTKYILRVTSGTAANLVNCYISWYEHINRI